MGMYLQNREIAIHVHLPYIQRWIFWWGIGISWEHPSPKWNHCVIFWMFFVWGKDTWHTSHFHSEETTPQVDKTIWKTKKKWKANEQRGPHKSLSDSMAIKVLPHPPTLHMFLWRKRVHLCIYTYPLFSRMQASSNGVYIWRGPWSIPKNVFKKNIFIHIGIPGSPLKNMSCYPVMSGVCMFKIPPILKTVWTCQTNPGGDEPASILGLEAIDPFVQKPAPAQHSPTKWTSGTGVRFTTHPPQFNGLPPGIKDDWEDYFSFWDCLFFRG